MTLLLVQFLATLAWGQSAWPGALVVRQGLNLNGNGVYFDSYDSSDPAKSTAGRYDSSKYSGNQGNITALGGITNTLNLGNAVIYGTLHIGPYASVSLGVNGGIGPHGAQVNDVNLALNDGYILRDALFLSLPDTSLPRDYFSYLPPQGGTVVTSSNAITATLTNSLQFPDPIPWGGVSTNVTIANSPTYPQPPPPGLTTNMVYMDSNTYPVPPPPGLVTNVQSVTNSSTLPTPVPPDCSTNYTTVLTTTGGYPAPGTYVGTITTNYTGAHQIKGYTYNLITGMTYNYSLYDYAWISYSYTWPNYSYTYNLFHTNAVYSTNRYDYVLMGNLKYQASSLAGNICVVGTNAVVVLPNGLTGAENFTFNQGASLVVYAGGSSATINAFQFLNPNFNPSSFVVYGAPSVSNLALNGSGSFTGVLIAPTADLRLNGSGTANVDFCGTLIVNSCSLNGHYSFHFDEALSRTAFVPPQISAQPQDQEVLAGQTAQFMVSAAGSGPLSYQWMFQDPLSLNGPVLIPGATNSTLVLTNAGLANLGPRFALSCPCAYYFVLVSNANGVVQSETAQLKIDFPPSITTQPLSQLAVPGSALTLAVQPGVANQPLGFQWRLNGSPLPGATDSTLVLPNVQSNNVGSYDVVLTNAFGSLTSEIATVGLTGAPDFLWAQAALVNTTNPNPSLLLAYASGVACDPTRHVWLSGLFCGQSLDFSGRVLRDSAFTAASTTADNFLCQYAPSGAPLWAWRLPGAPAKNIQGSTGWCAPRVATDAAGNCYFAGRFSGTAGFGTAFLTSQGPNDFFLVKMNNAGALLWVRQITTDWTNGVGAFGFAVGPSNQIVLSSTCAGSVTWSNLVLTNISGFLAQYDAAGNLLWAHESLAAEALALGPNGDIYLSDGATGPGTLAKYDNQGNLLWSRSFPHALALAVDSRNNVYATGYGAGTYDGLSLTNSGGVSDFFLAKCDPTGLVRWLRQLGSLHEQCGHGIALDRFGGVYVVGASQDAAPDPVLAFGATTLTNVAAFVAEYDTAGDALWARSLGATPSVLPGPISVASPQEIYLGGAFEQSAAIGSFTLTDASPEPFSDVFLAKLAGLPPPQLGTPCQVAGAQLQFTVDGASGVQCVVEGSTNLLDWVPLSTNAVPFTFTDAEAASFPTRYYRVRYRPE